QAGPVLGPARPRHEPCADERPADEDGDGDEDGGLDVVIGGRAERDGPTAGEERRRNDDQPEPCGRFHPSSAAIASAEISALGTKPRAPDSSTSEPKSLASRLEGRTMSGLEPVGVSCARAA